MILHLIVPAFPQLSNKNTLLSHNHHQVGDLTCIQDQYHIPKHNTTWTHLLHHSFNARSTGRCSAEMSPRCFQTNSHSQDFSRRQEGRQQSVKGVLNISNIYNAFRKIIDYFISLLRNLVKCLRLVTKSDV